MLTCGAALIGRSLNQLHSENWVAFVVLALLAIVGSALKVRLPGLDATISINFLPILLAAVMLSSAEVVMIAAASGITQCLVRARKKPHAIQVGFNAANLAISAWVANGITTWLTQPWMPQIATIAAAVAATIYYVCNAVLLCGLICAMQQKPFGVIWSRTYWLSLPYYIAGSALVFASADVALRVDWRPALLILPMILLGHRFYSRWVSETSAAGN